MKNTFVIGLVLSVCLLAATLCLGNPFPTRPYSAATAAPTTLVRIPTTLGESRSSLFAWLRVNDAVVDHVAKDHIRAYLSQPLIDQLPSAVGLEAHPVPLEDLWPGLLEQKQTKREKRSGDDLPPDHEYHDYESLTEFLRAVTKKYPSITKLYTAGRTLGSHELWYIELSNRPGIIEKKPYFKYIGNMHGDETIGREVLIQLIYELCEGYTSGNQRYRSILDNAHVFIMPSMNPDGFEARSRYNIRNIDLNRNFPDQFRGNPPVLELETQFVMKLSEKYPFALSANMHGGALVANYPYDGNQDGENVYSRSPDDTTFIWLSKAYANAHKTMSDSQEFPGGIINGADWYVLYGGMQDWNYLKASTLEITLELSEAKFPSEDDLDDFWDENKEALISYIEKVFYGIQGTVTDKNGNGIGGVCIQIKGIENVMETRDSGFYHRIVSPGKYTAVFSAFNCTTQAVNFTISDAAPTFTHDVQLSCGPLSGGLNTECAIHGVEPVEPAASYKEPTSTTLVVIYVLLIGAVLLGIGYALVRATKTRDAEQSRQVPMHTLAN